MDDLDFGIRASSKLKALLLVLLSVFMSALAVGIAGAPMNMRPVLAFLLKAFILLVFGGIATGCIAQAYQSLKTGLGVPRALLNRCLTCGESSPGDVLCPICGEPPQDRSIAFRIESKGIGGEAILSTILAGVACLGIFIMIGPWLDGERRLWALIAFTALGLLMLTVGSVGIVGFALVLREKLKGTRDVFFSCKSQDRSANGKGKLAWGQLAWLEGHGQIIGVLLPEAKREGGYRAAAGDLALAEAIATFSAAGLVELGDVVTYDWRIGDPALAKRTEPVVFERKHKHLVTMVNRYHAHVTWDEDEHTSDEAESTANESPTNPNEDMQRFLYKYANPGIDVATFRDRVDEDPLHRTQALMHAQVLRARGIVPAQDVVDAVVDVLVPEK